jgi:DME family drug/metabolite transporter
MRSRLFVIFSGICFGTTGTAQALGPKGASPLTVGAARLLVGSLLLILVAVRSKNLELVPIRKIPKRAWIIAGLSMSFYQVTFFAGVRVTGVAVGTVVALGSAPALTGLVSWVFMRQRPNQVWFIATSIAIIGVGAIASAGKTSHINSSGVLLALGAGLSYAFFAVFSKEILRSGISSEKAMAKIFAIGAAPLLPLLIFGDAHWLFTPRGIALALWLGLIPTTIAYLAYGAGLRHIPANDAATLTLSEPITATILGIILIHEHPSVTAWVGVVLVFAALVMLSARKSQAKGQRSLPA